MDDLEKLFFQDISMLIFKRHIFLLIFRFVYFVFPGQKRYVFLLQRVQFQISRFASLTLLEIGYIKRQ
ncbi:hypothetical protein L1987_30142 [Smallanthus sonchifolius]|uniref:Uncharacterized protein n=1 Tax=Smallanthus sonchifolius TaxID=185202 RepID=A0ACB9I208_9ASTR|nr:hypothetical protein L1987_30142 [Smallanthus sonchifolius]